MHSNTQSHRCNKEHTEKWTAVNIKINRDGENERLMGVVGGKAVQK